MTSDLILNDLSILPASEDELAGQQKMEIFLRVILKAAELGFNRTLRTQENFWATPLAENYPVNKWRNDSTVARELRLKLLSLVTKAPYINSNDAKSLVDRAALAEFIFNGRIAVGLGVAYMMNTIAISMGSDEKWDAHILSVNHTFIEEESLEVFCLDNSVIHASTLCHLEQNREAIKQLVEINFSNAKMLWEHRYRIFPNLLFCDSVYDDLIALNDIASVRLIANKLQELDSYSSAWDSGGFNAKLLTNVSVESKTTFADFKLRTRRQFKCPDGQERFFEWHSKLSKNLRIHFFPLSDERTILIGYVGKHLPTTSYPT